jgi:flagellar motor protein MotB
MRYRTNPWPAFADLFSATLIVTFAGMVMITAAYKSDVDTLKNQATNANAKVDEARHKAENANQLAQNANTRAHLVEVAVRQARLDANRVIEQVKQALDRDTSMKTRTRECGDDTCIDLYIEFERNDALIKDPDDLAVLRSVSSSLKKAIKALPPEQRKDIEIVIEGHTDKTQPSGSQLDERSQYLYNWDLSARRATSIAYELQRNGLTAKEYRIVAIGYADSDPICFEGTPECDDRNRRTTIFLRGDTRGIEKRLARQQAAGGTGR